VKGATEQPDEAAVGDPALEQRSRELFNQQVDSIDARTRSRLNRARQAALAAASGESRSASQGARWLLPVGSAAALALVTVSAVQLMRAQHEVVPVTTSLAATSTVDDVEILTSSDELDMLQNVDFYAWLDTQSDSLDAASGVSETG
jgi:Protein of unknown function (DUF3619)